MQLPALTRIHHKPHVHLLLAITGRGDGSTRNCMSTVSLQLHLFLTQGNCISFHWNILQRPKRNCEVSTVQITTTARVHHKIPSNSSCPGFTLIVTSSRKHFWLLPLNLTNHLHGTFLGRIFPLSKHDLQRICHLMLQLLFPPLKHTQEQKTMKTIHI